MYTGVDWLLASVYSKKAKLLYKFQGWKAADIPFLNSTIAIHRRLVQAYHKVSGSADILTLTTKVNLAKLLSDHGEALYNLEIIRKAIILCAEAIEILKALGTQILNGLLMNSVANSQILRN